MTVDDQMISNGLAPHTSTPDGRDPADADLDRELRRQQAERDLAEQKRDAKEARRARRRAADLRSKQAKRAVKRRRKRVFRRARRVWWTETKARFAAALDGRLVAVLVALAAGTAWYGQYHYLAEGQHLLVVFAAAGATALEVLGLAMGAVARAAGDHRERALRARLLMWAVIAFSAWSNYQHNGIVLAALSVAGPTAWEVREWWQRRARLHAAGLLQPRPVRPRFPLDQWLLYLPETLAAYRVAVRDRIEDATEALSVAKAERAERRDQPAPGRHADDRPAEAIGATESAELDDRPEQPERPRRRRPKRTRPGDRDPATEMTDVDVSDLLPDALEIAAELGDRLTRDALLKGLRARGHRLGPRRRDAIYAAVRAAIQDSTTEAHPPSTTGPHEENDQ